MSKKERTLVIEITTTDGRITEHAYTYVMTPEEWEVYVRTMIQGVWSITNREDPGITLYNPFVSYHTGCIIKVGVKGDDLPDEMGEGQSKLPLGFHSAS